jgi:glycosyltransferase involved in cell wall biosynthesis
MKIMQIAHVNVPVMGISGGYGGLEEVVSILDKQYTRMDHESLVVASSDSEIDGTLLPTINSLYGPGKGHLKGDKKHTEEGFIKHAKKILEYIRELKPDVIHDHTGYHKDRSFSEKLFDKTKGLRTSWEIKHEKIPPILNTIHGYVNKENKDMYENFQKIFNKVNISFNSVSQFQRSIFRGILDVDHVVLNGVDTDSYTFGEKGKGYAFSMSSIYRGKGTHVAINTALKNKKKLILAGPYFHNINYWNELKKNVDRIELNVPANELDGLVNNFVNSKDKILYLGELGAKEKRIVYTGADAFYFPVIIDETFGLTSAEANASGVPVISYLSGGVPEVVNHGKTGFTVKRNCFEKFKEAALKEGEISRKYCREWAVENFSAQRQANDYLNIYREILNK